MAAATQDASESSPLLQTRSETASAPSAPAAAQRSSPPSLSLPPPVTPTKPPATTKTTPSGPPPPSPSALVRPGSDPRSKPPRSVTFDPNPVTRTIEPPPQSVSPVPQPAAPFRYRGGPSTTATAPALSSLGGPASYGTISATPSSRAVMGGGGPGAGGSGSGSGGVGPPVLAAINNRLRRRNSYGSGPLISPQQMQHQQQQAPSKIGPQRTTKNAQKLKLLPNPDFGDEGPDEESGRDVYSQYTRIKDPTARRDAALLGKADRARLPRVTAYCTANRYEMDGLMRFLKGRGKTRGGNPKLIDECIYTPYNYDYVKNNGHTGTSSHQRSYLPGGREDGSVRNQQGHHREQEQVPNQDWIRGEQTTASQYSHHQERRHSTGEVDADSHSQLRRDDLLDLESGDGDNEDRHRRNRRQNEEAILADDDERLARDTRTGSDRYGDGNHEAGTGDEFYEDNNQQRQQQQQQQQQQQVDLLGDLDERGAGSARVEDDEQRAHDELFEQQLRGERPVDFDIHVHTPELFLFDYGVVVIWGMSEAQEQRFLKELAKFETEKLAPDDVEAEFFNFYYTREYQARIYNDFIALRGGSDKGGYMTKLAISHALAQSVKTSLFEELIASTIETCKDIPAQIALTGTIALSRTQINMQIGELFILRINIHLNGSVLDTPELFWVEPQLEPVYQAVRSYLEMDQRVGLLTQRLDVIADLLAVLKEQLSHGHGEKLEWIVIILIAAEILVAAINIVVDLYAG